MNNLEVVLSNKASKEVIMENWLDSVDIKKNSKLAYKCGITNFLKWLNKNDVSVVDKKIILKYKNYLSDNYSSLTSNLYLMSIKSLYSYLEENNISTNVAKKIKNFKVSKESRKSCFSIEQIKSILNSLEKTDDLSIRNYVLVSLLIRTGLRACEVSNANIEDLKVKNGMNVLYIKGKGHDSKDEFVVITKEMSDLLNKYLNTRKKYNSKSPLFASLSDKSIGGRLSPATISWIFKQILRAVGIDSHSLTLHSTRHTAITLSILAGADVLEVKNFARHKDINTTLKYIHSIDRIDKAPEKKIEDLLTGNIKV